MNMNRYFICIGNPRLHSCLSKNIFDINSYKSKIKKRSTTKKLRNGLESLRDAKINKKLETLKTKPGFLSTGRGVYINIYIYIYISIYIYMIYLLYMYI